MTDPTNHRAARIRLLRRTSLVLALVLSGLALPTTAYAAEPSHDGAGPDLAIASGRRQLSAAEIRLHDVTETNVGQRLLQRARGHSLEVGQRAFRAFVFGQRELVVSAAMPITVFAGKNRAGKTVYDVLPMAVASDAVPEAGYAIPPSSAWHYSSDTSFDETVGTWYRVIWSTRTKANNWKACSSCTPYDYYRIYGKMRASAVTGAGPNEGFKRAWLEFDRYFPSSVDTFETDRPAESYGGVANQTTTVGFGANFEINIGLPPVTATGGYNTTYGGSMTKSSENWHPVIRTEIGSGGVQWCRYESAEFTGTKVISARTSVRLGYTASAPGWFTYTGQSDSYSSCPSQV